MTKDNQKRLSEKRHRTIFRYLKREFPACEVTYNGVEGHDHSITFQGKKTWVETKTCNTVIGAGINYKQQTDLPIIFEKHRLGTFKFDRRNFYPYEISQHDDLVKINGWYIFIVGGGRYTISGIPAKDLKLKEPKNVKRISWSTILAQCYPDWLERLKIQVYRRE